MNHISKAALKPILVVDKNGILGDKLSHGLAKDFIVIYVTQKKVSYRTPSAHYRSENVIFSEYNESAPVIPNYKYSLIFIVDSGVWTRSFISSFIKKARKDGSQLLFLVSLFNWATFYNAYRKIKVKPGLAKDQDNLKIIIFGEIFDTNMPLPFMAMAKRHETIYVKGDGLSKTYPVFLDDAIFELIDLALASRGDGFSIFYLFPKYPPTQITLARLIQKANPSVQIDFVGSYKKEQEIKYPPTGKYLFPDSYSLEKRINELKIENLSLPTYSKKQHTRKPLSWFFLILLFFLFLPFVSTVSFSFFGFVGLGNVKTAIENGNLSDAKRLAYVSRTFFDLAYKTSGPLWLEAKIIGQEDSLLPILKKISFGKDLSYVSLYTLDSSEILSRVFAGKSEEAKEDFTKAINLLKKGAILFRQHEKEEEIPKDSLAKLKDIDSVVKLIENTIDILPILFGFEGKKTYLVLFQNNMELRPGGGFIGSYGLLTVDSGRIEDFSIHDVYDADGQLKDHVEPPYPLRRHLDLPHLYLRDSNFDVDFERSAQSAALLLNKELGNEVDGIIGIDVSFVKNILEAIGEVYVSDYRQTVTSDNLYEITQSHAEKDFFPGSRQKKNFLSSLFSSIQAKISDDRNLPYLALAKNVSRAIDEKHLLFASSDSSIQDIFIANGWSSSLLSLSRNTNVLGIRNQYADVIDDFLGINEANLGVNKANYFVKRKLFHSVKIDETGGILSKIRIEYENESDKWPGGDYANYLRIILPFDTTLLSISFDNVPQEIVPAVTDFRVYEAKDFVPPEGLEVERYEQDGKTIYGFLVTVEAGNEKAIEIEYRLSRKLSEEANDFSYNLEVFKQPGTNNYPYSFSLTYPKDLRIVNGSPSTNIELATDKELNIDFTQIQ